MNHSQRMSCARSRERKARHPSHLTLAHRLLDFPPETGSKPAPARLRGVEHRVGPSGHAPAAPAPISSAGKLVTHFILSFESIAPRTDPVKSVPLLFPEEFRLSISPGLSRPRDRGRSAWARHCPFSALLMQFSLVFRFAGWSGCAPCV